MGFPRKNLEFFEIAKDSKFAVECYWNSKISQNVQNLVFVRKIDGFLQKNLEFFKSR